MLARHLFIAIVAACAIGSPHSTSFSADGDAVAKFRAEEQLAWDKWRLQKQKSALYDANSLTLGATQPKVRIVEFFDYNCPFCRRAQPRLMEFLNKNPDVQIVLKDVAFLGKHSLAVARIMLAARKQKNTAELHSALMDQKGLTTETIALDIAGILGFDIQRLKNDAEGGDIQAAIEETQNLAHELRFTSVPIFVGGHTIISGAPEDLTEMLSSIAEDIRKNGCDVC
jgi:protein-disulfide isomerase